MDFTTIYLSGREIRRFLEIAKGDTVAKNTPQEDALFRYNLIEEYLKAETDLPGKSTSVDYRAIKLSDLGKIYYAQYLNHQIKQRKEDRRHWLNVVLTIIGIAVAVAAIVIPYIFAIN